MKLSHGMHLALEAWPALDRDKWISNASAIDNCAIQYGVSPSGLYRALLQRGLIERTKPKAKRKA